MPRPPRLHIPDACYHITLRGNHREPLFETRADRAKLNRLVADATSRFGVRLHAFCWMTNHLHALVQVGKQPLGGFVASVASRYSRYRHRAMGTSGHLFERRYGSKLIDIDAYFLTVLRYIHLNPVKAGIVHDPRAYPWTSHRMYLGSQTVDWVTVDFGLSLFGRDPKSARAAYARFIGQDTSSANIDLDAKTHPEDRRILGSDEFVDKLTKLPSVRSERPLALDELASRICADREITLGLLRSRSAAHWLTPVRVELLEQALARGVANLSEVAHYLGRDASTLSRQLKSKRSKNAMTGT